MGISMFRRAVFFACAFVLASSALVNAGNFGNAVVIPKEMSFALGPEYDLTTRHLTFEDDGTVDLFANRIFVDLAYNPIEFMRIKLKGGIGNMAFNNSDFGKVKKFENLSEEDLLLLGEGVTREDVIKEAEGVVDDVNTPFNFAGGGQLDFAFMKDPKKYIGIGLTGNALYQMGKKDEISVGMLEYGGALTFALISLGTIVPYAGFDYSGVSGSLEIKPKDGGKSETYDLANNLDYPVGMFAGLNIILGDSVRLELEGRFLNELSGGLSVLYVF